MLSHEENAFLCGVAAETPMGQNLRRYWWPVLASNELVGQGRDCTPQRVKVLGEQLVAFRSIDGSVALMGEKCPHRGASLALGVVEDCGVRCVFHGWKIGADGSILDAPNVQRREGPSGGPLGFKHVAYPAREAGGIVWAYLGAAEHQPPFLDYRFFESPAENRWISVQIIDANFVQVLEGSLDPSHLAVLHQDAMRIASVAVDPSTTGNVLTNLAPPIDLERTNFGFRLLTVRQQDEQTNRVRPTTYVAPASVFIPRSPKKGAGGLITVTPIDDVRSMQMLIMWDEEEAIGLDPVRSEMLQYFGVQEEIMASFGIDRANCDRPGKPTLENCFFQDRKAIAEGRSFTGIPDFVPEDVAVAVSQGPLADRSIEHLVKADIGIVEMRKVLMNSAKRVQEGDAPYGLDGTVDTYEICAHEYTLPIGAPPSEGAPKHSRTQTQGRRAVTA